MLDPLPRRVYAARRAATLGRLRGAGMPFDDAGLWVAAWEAYASSEGLDPDDREFWRRGAEWIAAEREAQRTR